MRKIIFLLLSLSVYAAGTLKAQPGFTSFQYVMGFGSGDLGEYISQSSFRGIVFEYQKNINTNVYAGAEVGWSVFYEKKDYATYTVEPQSLSGVQYRYSNQVPILITASYFLRPAETLRPYANLGIGTMYSKRETDMGIWRSTEDAWHFALKPEIGLMYEMSFSTSFKLAAKYYTGFAAGDLETQSYFAISAGLAFLF